MEKEFGLKCSLCGVKACNIEEEKQLPAFCPTPVCEDITNEAVHTYLEDDKIRTMVLEAARVESEGYCRWTRVEETIHFADRMGYKNIGIAHCAALMEEAKIVHKIFESNGFKVNSVCCKAGRIDKEEIGFTDKEKVHPGKFETACNPITQAKLLERAGTEFNIVMGLCIGHDSLFLMHSKVPTTVLIVKDRVLGHNPVAALYTSHSFYKHLLK
jgi:uncharacterized metal-binding protein